MITEQLVYEGVANTLTWLAVEPFPAVKVTQVRGYVFDEAGRVLIAQNKNGEWTTVGGKPEAGETLQQTFAREVMEEACVEIGEAKVVGAIHVKGANGVEHLQVRMVARLVRQLPFEAQYEMQARAFVPVEKLAEYIPWTATSPVFAAEMAAALGKLKTLS